MRPGREADLSGLIELMRNEVVEGRQDMAPSESFFFRELKFIAFARGQNWEVSSLYSTLKTGFPASRNGWSLPHSWYWKHCSLSVKSK